MSFSIARLFHLQRGDGRRGALLFAYLFLIITCYQLGKMARDALFLSAFKASKLPYADMTIALSVGVAVALYLTVGRRTAPRTLMVGCLLAFAILQCGFWYLATFHHDAPVAIPSLLRLGGGLRGAGPDTGLDARQLSPDDTRGQARLRPRRRRRHHGVDFFRLPRQRARPDAGTGHREPAPGDGDHSRDVRRAGGGPVAREGEDFCGRRGRPGRGGAEEPAEEPRGGLLLPVSDGDRVADHAVLGRHHLRRMAVQGDRQERLPQHERPDGLLRTVQLLGGSGVPRPPASADLPVPPPLRPRSRPAARAAGFVRRRARRPRPRHPRCGHPAQGVRSGSPLFDRQVLGRAALPPRPRGDQAPGEVGHRHRHLALRRRSGRSHARHLHGPAPLVAAEGVDRQHLFHRRVDCDGARGAAALPADAASEHPPAASGRRAAVRSGSRPDDRRPPGEATDLLRLRGGALRAGGVRCLAGPGNAPGRARRARSRGPGGAAARARGPRRRRRPLRAASRRRDAARPRSRGAFGGAPLPGAPCARRSAAAHPGARRLSGRLGRLRDRHVSRALGRSGESAGSAHADRQDDRPPRRGGQERATRGRVIDRNAARRVRRAARRSSRRRGAGGRCGRRCAPPGSWASGAWRPA